MARPPAPGIAAPVPEHQKRRRSYPSVWLSPYRGARTASPSLEKRMEAVQRGEAGWLCWVISELKVQAGFAHRAQRTALVRFVVAVPKRTGRANDGLGLLQPAGTAFWGHTRFPISISEPYSQGSTRISHLRD